MPSKDHLLRYLCLIEGIIGESIPQGALPSLPADSVLDNWVSHQQPSGAFLPPDAKTNAEARWFDEMRILHALVARDTAADNAAIKKAAEYHLFEIQPDHATADPWALLAYIQYAPPLADQVLHAVRVQYPQGVHGVALLLLSDALYGLQRLIKDKSNEQ